MFPCSNKLALSRHPPNVSVIYKHPIPTCPGKSIISFLITFPPNGSTPPHSHRGAFVSANIVSGHIINAMNKQPMQLLGPGDTFVEYPGCKHRVCDNASEAEEASISAVFVVDTEVLERYGEMGLVDVNAE